MVEQGEPQGDGGAATTALDAAGLDKSGKAIRDMFGAVARHYDLLNHLLSASLDRVWRRRAAAALDLPPGAPVLDLCCGTGDQAVALGRRRGARVAAADFCLPMLALARRKFRRELRRLAAPPAPAPLAADALALPFPERCFTAATVSFGLRNVADLDTALVQLAGVLRPGGQLAVLEFAVPVLPPLRALYLLYFRRLLPAIGRLISDSSSAYSYLPSSVLAFPQRRDFLDRMAAAGFADLAWRDLSGGIVCLYTGRIPG
ncbi:MAG TPA: ubiquinone/menaquinone biosynthesis methyltransferase [Thermoanaerobaculia bacterium]|nr:ubiquinone/menaquinone biosynthesis methyltransferase [Thermoanaerobaculia bacterium]